MRGLVFNVQRFSIHDGPGIRTTVFMKGCPLRCLWCSNPESQDFAPNLMVRDIQCKGCGACAKACPQAAIEMDGGGRQIDWTKCTQCLKCVDACLYNSLNVCGRYVEVGEVLDEVVRDEAFYRNSGGGITVSGGEPLSQGEFVALLLEASKRVDLHTALDTTGFAPWEKLERVLPSVDLILWDIKHLDPVEHRRTSGVDNELILENLARAAKLATVWLRIPLIAGFNDSEEHLERVAILGQRIGAVKVSLLPYHEGGVSKSEQIGRSYPYREGRAPEKEWVQHLKVTIERHGIQAGIGA